MKIGEMWKSECKSGAFLGPTYNNAIARHYITVYFSTRTMRETEGLTMGGEMIRSLKNAVRLVIASLVSSGPFLAALSNTFCPAAVT